MMCNLDETEDHKVARFVAGLDEYLKERVELQPYWTFEEVCKVAKRAETRNQAKKTGSFIRNYEFKTETEVTIS